MKKKRYYQIAAGSLAVLACVSVYVFVLGSECTHSLCHAYAAEPREVALQEEILGEIESSEGLPERYSDPEYLEDLEVVQEEVGRREEIEMQSSLEAQISLERATQKALELRQQKDMN